jgi:hypothetical protein
MLIVKMMSAEDAPDEDTRKTYRLITGVIDARFERDEEAGGPVMYVWYSSPDEDRPSTFCISGNVYIMNEAGRTISSFGASEIPKVANPPTPHSP